jgi:hypothetical protein
MLAAGLLLVFVNFLAFHDFREPHSVRDWLMLIASALLIVQFARIFWSRSIGRR